MGLPLSAVPPLKWFQPMGVQGWKPLHLQSNKTTLTLPTHESVMFLGNNRQKIMLPWFFPVLKDNKPIFKCSTTTEIIFLPEETCWIPSAVAVCSSCSDTGWFCSPLFGLSLWFCPKSCLLHQSCQFCQIPTFFLKFLPISVKSFIHIICFPFTGFLLVRLSRVLLSIPLSSLVGSH